MTLKQTIQKLNPWTFEGTISENFLGINRETYLNKISTYLSSKEIILLTGVRRSGKSTIMYQLINKLLKNKVPKENICYFNFDVPIENSLKTIENILSTFKEITNPKNKIYLFLDEIQVIDNWHNQIKAIYDTNPNIKFILTGSNNSLLKSNTATLLTGRIFHIEVFPVDFKEYLKFKNINISSSNIEELKHNFQNFIQFGGFPEVVKEENQVINEKRHRDYYEGILFRDILSLGKIKEESKLNDLGLFCSTNIGTLFSYNKISKALGISVDSVKEYLNQMENAYLVFQLKKYSYSVKETIQIQTPRKIYFIDTGLRNTLAFSFSKDLGRIIENVVFLQFKSNGKDIYYHKNKFECDFVIREGLKIKEAIQVCENLKDTKTKQREINGLLEAMSEYKLKEGIILTLDEEDELIVENKKIKIIPLYKYLMV
ncbi:MAG: ATP-binding protein [Candidatus Nanoarchaeia archaeon]|nr:ATP-binding protein [Candidatus Nanoarchaeia archaeon]